VPKNQTLKNKIKQLFINMDSLEGLNDLIYKRLIETNGNVKLTENNDIVLYGKNVGLSENELLFKILEVEETIDWTAIEKLKQLENTSRNEVSNSVSSYNANSHDIVFCKNCNSENEKGVANFCVDCGSELNPKPNYEPHAVYGQNQYVEPQYEPIKKSNTPIVIGVSLAVLMLVFGSVYYFANKSHEVNNSVDSIAVDSTAVVADTAAVAVDSSAIYVDSAAVYVDDSAVSIDTTTSESTPMADTTAVINSQY
jgi:hypothetical protein